MRANAVAYLALFVALGGTGAWAADKITSKDIARNAVRSKHIYKNSVRSKQLKNGTVKGVDVDEASLGLVPSAGLADRANRAAMADSATTAGSAAMAGSAATAATAANAQAVGGNIVRRVAHLSGDVTDQRVLDLAGLQLDVSCVAGGEDLDATTTVPDGEISIIRDDAGGANPQRSVEDDFDPGDTVQVNTTAAPSDNVIDLRYTGGDGRVVVAELVTDDDVPAGNCVVSGFAIGG